MSRDGLIRGAVAGMLAVTLLIVVGLRSQATRHDPCRDSVRQQSLVGLPPGVRIVDRPNIEPDRTFFGLSGNLAADPDYTIFTILRTFDVNPATSGGYQVLGIPMDPQERWSTTIEVDGESIPVDWSSEVIGDSTHLAAEIRFLGLRAVESLLVAQVSSLADRLKSGAPPISFYAFEIVGPTSEIPARKPLADEWLVSAVRHFRDSCGRE